MRELSLHILDVAENSLRAGASLVEILVEEDIVQNKVIIKILDNGCGMEQEYAAKVLDPFITERTTRTVGLGLPMFAAIATHCSGHLQLNSEPNIGTEVLVEMERDNIDRPPIGDMASTIVSLLCHDNPADILYRRVVEKDEFVFDTRELKKQLEEIPLTEPSVLNWIREYIFEKEDYYQRKGASDNEINS